MLMERARWGNTPRCAHCDSGAVYKMADRATDRRNKDYRWRCRDCRYRFTVRTGTLLENTRLSLPCWCLAFHCYCSTWGDESAERMQTEVGTTYKTALFLLHRIHFVLADRRPQILKAGQFAWIHGIKHALNTPGPSNGWSESLVARRFERERDDAEMHLLQRQAEDALEALRKIRFGNY